MDKSFGKRPSDAFLHSPTPWGDLYRHYNWTQTSTVVEATSGEILEVTSNPVALATKTLENDSSFEGEFSSDLSESVSNTVTTSWNMQHTVSVNQKIKYSIGFLGTGGGGETDFGYSLSWGEGGEKSKSITIGSSSGVKVNLKPHQAVVATLTANQGVMKVRIRYKAHLAGGTAINYNPRYQGHHFWYLPIENVMMDADIPNSLEFTEDVEIGYYSGGKVELKDKASNKKIASYSHAAALPGVGGINSE